MLVTQNRLEAFPPNSNPFHHDSYHMGQRFGKNHMLMFPNHASDELKYFILIDTSTGERIKFTVESDAGVESLKRDLEEVKFEDTEPTS